MVHFFDIEPGLSHRFTVYNNIAEHEEIEGRLTSEILLGDQYRLDWEFEWYDPDAPRGGTAYIRKMPVEDPLPPLVGKDFKIPEPIVHSSGPKNVPGRKYIDDGTFTAGYFEDPEQEVEDASFYLVNLTMGELPFWHKSQLHPEDAFDEHEKQGAHGVITEDGFHTRDFKNVVIDAYVDDYWRVQIEFEREVVSENVPSTGFWVTATGALRGPPDPLRENVRTITLSEAQARISRLCSLLSFANGGLTASVFVEGGKLSFDEHDEFVGHERAGIVSRSPVTPIQDIGLGLFPPRDHDLGPLLTTLPVFERLLDVWGDKYHMMLADYHKALSPYAPFRSRARSIGSALEALSLVLLRSDFDGEMSKTQYKDLFFVQKLDALLFVAGLDPVDDLASTDEMKKMRNDGAHSELSIDDALRDPAFRSAVCLFEEVLLWRLGYEGRYCPKTGSTWRFEPYRYKLGNRLPDW